MQKLTSLLLQPSTATGTGTSYYTTDTSTIASTANTTSPAATVVHSSHSNTHCDYTLLQLRRITTQVKTSSTYLNMPSQFPVRRSRFPLACQLAF
jgi:hypothetical protein